MALKTLVNFSEYNNHRNVLFVMNAKDVEKRKAMTSNAVNIQVISVVDVKNKAFSFDDKEYFVNSDCSVSQKV